jgi:hypothetical protein
MQVTLSHASYVPSNPWAGENSKIAFLPSFTFIVQPTFASGFGNSSDKLPGINCIGVGSVKMNVWNILKPQNASVSRPIYSYSQSSVLS